jgi:hypothetical protein
MIYYRVAILLVFILVLSACQKWTFRDQYGRVASSQITWECDRDCNYYRTRVHDETQFSACFVRCMEFKGYKAHVEK